jgi:hypothetical protein
MKVKWEALLVGCIAVSTSCMSTVLALSTGMTAEDACSNLTQGAACGVYSPNMVVEIGTCEYKGVGTEAPDVTEAANPAIVACSLDKYEIGSSCSFFDASSGVEVTGECETSTTTQFTGLSCVETASSENLEEVVCDDLSLGALCEVFEGDGSSTQGTCEDSGIPGVLKCELNSDSSPTGSGGPAQPEGPEDEGEIACMLNPSNFSAGFLATGSNCSYVKENGQIITGTCVSKAGGTFDECESTDIGLPIDEPENPSALACEGLSENSECNIVEEVYNTSTAGSCEISGATGELDCIIQPSDDQRRSLQWLYLSCQMSSNSDEDGFEADSSLTTDALGTDFDSAAGPLVGGIIGGLVGLAIIVVGGIFLHRKLGQKRLNIDVDNEGGDVYQTL